MHNRRVNKYWDVPPNGFEHMSVAEYKMLQAQGQVPRLSVQVRINTLLVPLFIISY